jgi:hypothetical protein
MTEPTFYLFASSCWKPDHSAESVFYEVNGELSARTLCELFNREYLDDSPDLAFDCFASESVTASDRILLDEAIDALLLYADPDSGVYDPPPAKGVIARAQYTFRAREWEGLLRRKTEQANQVKVKPLEGDTEEPPFTTDKLPEMSAEDSRNMALNLLMLLTQAYYTLLESAVRVPHGNMDPKLNQSYFWTLENIRNLLANHPDLADFPVPFEPLFPDLSPSTVCDVGWEDAAAPFAERFLSTVREYVLTKGARPLEQGSIAGMFIEMFKPGINSAIESGVSYRRRMNQDFQKLMEQSAKTAASSAAPSAATSREPQAQKPPPPPAVMEQDAILDLCRQKPNQAFLFWQSFEADLAQCPPLGRENEKKFRAMRDTFREWFEDLGHWRDLRPKSKDLDPDDHNAHAKHQKQIEVFMAKRQSRLRPIKYDEARKVHRVQCEGTEHEDAKYNWEFFRDGVSQLILRTAGGNVLPPHSDPLKRQYFKNTPPSGYAILESGDKLEGTVFLHNGDSYGFDPCFGDENRFYPEELFRAGDYELRKVGKKRTTLEAVHEDVRETKEIATRLPTAIASVEKGIESMQPHLRGVPKVLDDLKEAKLVPEDATRELFTRIQDTLTLEQQRIWTAVRNAGTQKGAIALLRKQDIDLSEATLSRRVHEIDEELAKHDLPPCKASGPRTRFTKSGGYTNDKGRTVPEELSEPDRDWADNPESRDSTIRSYLSVSDKEKADFHRLYYGIEDEADEYEKRSGMKSG